LRLSSFFACKTEMNFREYLGAVCIDLLRSLMKHQNQVDPRVPYVCLDKDDRV